MLLVTIVVSIAVLLLLSQFRFPEESGQRLVDPAPAPLERLAARGAYDELASAMADLERRIAPRVVVFRVRPARSSGEFVVAPRVAQERAVAILGPNEALAPFAGVEPAILTREFTHHVAVLRVPAAEGATVSPQPVQPRTGPRYLVAVEGTSDGPSLRPVYVGRLALSPETAGAPVVTLSGLQAPLSRGAAIFTIEGTFLGLVTEGGAQPTLIGGDVLRAAAEQAQPTPVTIGDFGIDVQPLTDPLMRATGADRGVMVSYVRPDGRAAGVLQPSDVIQSIAGVPINSVAAFRQVERNRGGNPQVPLTIVRSGTVMEVALTTAGQPQDRQQSTESGVIGRTVTGTGVEIVAVRAGSAAATADIRRGDLIVLLNAQAAPTATMLDRAYRALKPGDVILLGVIRDHRQRIVPLEKR